MRFFPFFFFYQLDSFYTIRCFDNSVARWRSKIERSACDFETGVWENWENPMESLQFSHLKICAVVWLFGDYYLLFASGLTRSPGWRMTRSLRYSQVVIKTANLVSHIVVQGSGGREIIVLNYLRAARLVFPIRPITSVICCFRRCLPKGPSLVIKSRVKSHFPLLFYAWTSCIVSLSYMLLSYNYLPWWVQAEHLLQERKKATKNQRCFKALVENHKPDW